MRRLPPRTNKEQWGVLRLVFILLMLLTVAWLLIAFFLVNRSTGERHRDSFPAYVPGSATSRVDDEQGAGNINIAEDAPKGDTSSLGGEARSVESQMLPPQYFLLLITDQTPHELMQWKEVLLEALPSRSPSSAPEMHLVLSLHDTSREPEVRNVFAEVEREHHIRIEIQLHHAGSFGNYIGASLDRLLLENNLPGVWMLSDALTWEHAGEDRRILSHFPRVPLPLSSSVEGKDDAAKDPAQGRTTTPSCAVTVCLDVPAAMRPTDSSSPLYSSPSNAWHSRMEVFNRCRALFIERSWWERTAAFISSSPLITTGRDMLRIPHLWEASSIRTGGNETVSSPAVDCMLWERQKQNGVLPLSPFQQWERMVAGSQAMERVIALNLEDWNDAAAVLHDIPSYSLWRGWLLLSAQHPSMAIVDRRIVPQKLWEKPIAGSSADDTENDASVSAARHRNPGGAQVQLLRGAASESCDLVCARGQLRCDSTQFPFINSCSLMQGYFECNDGCWEVAGSLAFPPAQLLTQSNGAKGVEEKHFCQVRPFASGVPTCKDRDFDMALLCPCKQ
jgi:hypothetical protein